MPEPRRAPFAPTLTRLTTRSILFVLASTLATALAVSAVAVQTSRQQLREDLADHSRFELERAGRSLADWLDARQLELAATLAALPSGASAEATHQRLEALPFIAQVERLQASHTSPQTSAPTPASQIQLAGSTPETTTLALTADRDGDVWRAGLEPSALAAALALIAPAAPHRLFLVDSAGRILDGGNPDHANADKLRNARFSESLLERANRPILHSQSDGEHIVVATPALAYAPARLVFETPHDAALAPARRLLGRILAVDLFVMLALGLLARRVAARAFGPIAALSEGATRISDGQLDHEIDDLGGRDEIGLLTRSFNMMMKKLRANQREIETTNGALRSRNEELQTANEILAQLSITDGLTHLHNHRYFQEQLSREIKIHERNSTPLSMLLIDLDNFKQLNDHYGHAAGDEVLVRVATLLNGSVRASDLLARYGGEEFVVLASNTNHDGAMSLAEKVRFAIAECEFQTDALGDPVRDVSVSVGVAQYRGDRREFFDAADRALYRAKSEGKNCVISAEES